MKRVLPLFLSLLLIVSLLTGCNTPADPYVPTGDGLSDNPGPTKPEENSQELPVQLVYDPDHTLNPYAATDVTNRTLMSLVYQSLFAVDRNYEAKPILCESYNVSADMKTYTFYIAKALFSDGTALTPEDVVASLQAAQKSVWFGGRLQHVQSIACFGEAVVVELSTALEHFPLLLDIPIVKASQVKEERPLGTGPYRYDGESLRRQAGWWCSVNLGIPNDTIPLVTAHTAAQIRDSFEYRGTSLVCTDPSARDYVGFHNDYELWDAENGLFLYLVCNSKSAVFSNETLRAALTYAIDRDMLAETYYHGFARSATLPCSPLSPFYISSLAAKYSYAPQAFQEALESTEMIGKEVKLLVNADDYTRSKVAKAIAAKLTDLGLKVTILEANSKNFKELLAQGNYDLYLAQTRLARNMDISAFFGMDTSLNYGGLSDPGIYAISLEALANTGNYYTLYEMVMEDAQLCPILFQSNAIYAQRGIFSKLNPTRDSIFYYDLGRSLEDALIRE